jgi:hypothetical protein
VKIILLSILAVAMIGLMVPSVFATEVRGVMTPDDSSNIYVNKDAIAYSFDISDKWIFKNSEMTDSSHGYGDAFSEYSPQTRVWSFSDSENNELEIFVAINTAKLRYESSLSPFQCEAYFDNAEYCKTISPLEPQYCFQKDRVPKCFTESKTPYMSSDGVIKVLRIAYWDAGDLDIIFAYDDEIADDIDHEYIMRFTYQSYNNTSEIPAWIKNNAGWWAEGQIPDSAFVQGIQFLIKEGVIVIPSTDQEASSESTDIPAWIKNNAGWWADGQIDDNSFVQGIQFLVKVGIIQVS